MIWLPNSSNSLPVTVFVGISHDALETVQEPSGFLSAAHFWRFKQKYYLTISLLCLFVIFIWAQNPFLYGQVCRKKQTQTHPEKYLLSPGPSELFRTNHNLINGLSELCLIDGSFRSYNQYIFIRDVYLGKIGERAETLRNIHRHMHFLLCIVRDEKDIKKFWTLNSMGSTNRSRIVSQVRSAMWQISCSFFFPDSFFSLKF